MPTADGLKSSLFATIGPSGVGGIGLSGHTDVVPVTGQAWDTDPFTMVERDGKLYGRGTCRHERLSGLRAGLVPDLVARPLKTPMHIVFSYDEEVGCTGVRPMIAELGKTLPLPRMVFVGEPTEMGVVDAHKGPVRWRVEVTGRPHIRAWRIWASTPSPTPVDCWPSSAAWRRSSRRAARTRASIRRGIRCR